MNPTPDSDLASLGAADLSAGYADGHFTPMDVLEAVRHRIDQLDPALNAFALREDAQADAAARESHERWRAGAQRSRLDGIPITLKENFATVGTPCRLGTAALADSPPQTHDSPVTERLAEAGAIRIGKTVMPDFGLMTSSVSSLHGITRNPWNHDWTVGGSSSGAAAAGAARFGPIHIGSDIGGSVRLPANWTGLVGFKPTYGIVPTDVPLMGRHVGVLARTVDDVVEAMGAIARPDPLDRDYTFRALPGHWDESRLGLRDGDLSQLRVGYLLDAGCGLLPTDPEVRTSVESAIGTFIDAGAIAEEITPLMSQAQFDALVTWFRARVWRDLQRLSRDQRDAILPYFVEWASPGARISASQVMDAYDAILEMRNRITQTIRGYDVVLSPVSPIPAYPAEWAGATNDPATAHQDIVFAIPHNFAELPAVSVNAGFTSDGRPIGVQIAGHRYDDLRLMQIARWFETSRPKSAVPIWP